jgi:GT2 family glycosyltransferase/tetratricopeptide (TPR) repeat protein/2-polyprenyl-3-methyl-5-hydroxy-6-metoxy-1,4-benzoquinol methylase
MSIQRVAIIFDNKTRPETTGVYCRRALGKLVEVEHFLPTELGQIPRRGFDLYLNIDDGLDYRLPPDLRPSAWWAIDTHMNYDGCRDKGRDFDLLFAAQRDGAQRLRQDGLAKAIWLPLACDPELHGKQNVSKQHDVCFIGNLFPGPRRDLVELIRRRFPNTFVGQRYFEEMSQTYSASRIVFNRSIKNDINMRVFEALAAGSLLLTNDLRDNGQNELFRDGIHLATYRDAEELLDKIQFYLAHEELRERIAAAGREQVLAKHAYRHRMQRILSEVERAGIRPVESLAPTRTAGPEHDGKAGPVAKYQSALPPSKSSSGDTHDSCYFDFARPELLALIPKAARTVLDIGCGAGRLGVAIKARQPAEVTGIEFVPEAARAAQGRLDRVLTGDVEQLELDFAPESFDTVICGDVLEHVRDPLRLLRRIKTWLRPDGQLIASIPNVRNHTVVRMLLEGSWTYESAGLLDQGHLRFFTRREIEKVLYRAGFQIADLQAVPGSGYEEWAGQNDRSRVKVGRLHMAGLPPEEAQEFYVYQYLIAASPSPDENHGLTSIVIVTHNQLAYTRQCVDSIRQYTDEPYELIFVDNASTDGTLDYLGSLGEVRSIRNEKNLGFPSGANQGIRAATGNQILLLNNDTLVTTGWLRRLLRALHSDSKTGLVGPCSNCVSGEQQVEVTYDDLTGLDGFAWDFGKANNGRLQPTDRLVGFCLLIRREVIDSVGLLDEQFGVGCFEDDDYCRRASEAGFRLTIACDAFVHHFGGQTFIGAGVDFAALMRENQRLFEAKWAAALGSNSVLRSPPRAESVVRGSPDAALLPTPGLPASSPTGTPPQSSILHPPSSNSPRFTLRRHPKGGLLLVRRTIELSACIIARDNARTIEACLKSIIPHVDEMVVVDTGSKDDTPKIAARLGARVEHFTWTDDFSAARNESIKHARGQWIFWMDTDDVIDTVNGRQLRQLIRSAQPSTLGFVVSVHCPSGGEDGDSSVTVVSHVKLFRNLPDLRFDGRIHEQILPAINAANGEVAWSDAFVLHAGYDHSPEGQKRKLERDLRILHQELKERPEHPFTLFNLGMTYADMGEYRQAADYLHRSLKASGPKESHLRKVYALLVNCYRNLELPYIAEDWCRQGLEKFPLDAELRFYQANLYHEAGRLPDAVRCFQHLLEVKEEPHYQSYDRGIDSFKTRQNLAVVYGQIGELEKAEEQWRLIVEEMPKYSPGWGGLGDNLVAQGKSGEARAMATQLLKENGLALEGLLLQSKLASRAGDIPSAERNLRQAVQDYPNQARPLEELSRFLFENGRARESEEPLKHLIKLDRENAPALHNLGSVYMEKGDFESAAATYRESLRLRPNWPASYLLLGRALKASGRITEAIENWEHALRIDPSNEEIRQALLRAKK